MRHIKKRTFYLFIFPLLLSGFCKCKPEFSTNANSEPFTIVYGLLNVSETEHYVKIYKSFVTEGNAYDVVKDIDRYSYKDSIIVSLNEYDAHNNLLRKIAMKDTLVNNKDSGLFFYPTQILYAAKAVLNRDYLYEIEIINSYTKNVVKVKEFVKMVGLVSITKPAGAELSITDRAMNFEFYTGENTSMYQVLLKYYYTEDLMDNTSRHPNPIVWEIGSITDVSPAGTGKIIPLTSGAPFFQKIAESIKDDDNVKKRHTDSLVLEVYSAGKDWSLYIQSNLPSTGINQDRLHYSNIIAYNTETGKEKYAMGVFSSRGVTTRQYRDLTINGSRDSLFFGRYTKHLRFTDIY